MIVNSRPIKNFIDCPNLQRRERSKARLQFHNHYKETKFSIMILLRTVCNYHLLFSLAIHLTSQLTRLALGKEHLGRADLFQQREYQRRQIRHPLIKLLIMSYKIPSICRFNFLFTFKFCILNPCRCKVLYSRHLPSLIISLT